MISHVGDRAMTADDLTASLERLRLQPAGTRTPSEVTQVQLDFLLARISSLTETLRATNSEDAARLASRLLLSDVALVAAQFRGEANAMSRSLSTALEGLATSLAPLEQAPKGD